MKPLSAFLLLFLFIFSACQSQPDKTKMLGRFNTDTDLLLANFDCKTDVDDLHSAAALFTLMSHGEFAEVNHHVVAGTYGTQEGLYVPGEGLFELGFSGHWSDAHADFELALNEVFSIVKPLLNAGGNVWIPEAGQSDFSAALVRKVQSELSNIETRKQIHIVQHSDWNEEVTTPKDLEFVKENTHYIKIADGNVLDNGTPGFRSEAVVAWQNYVTTPALTQAWQMAYDLGKQYNGAEGRYENGAVTRGGLDFSDHSEVAYIFGLEDLHDANAFFQRFGH